MTTPTRSITCLDGRTRECERNLADTGWGYLDLEDGYGTVLVIIPDRNVCGSIEVRPDAAPRRWSAHGSLTVLAQREVRPGTWILLADWNGQYVTWAYREPRYPHAVTDLFSGNYFGPDRTAATANFAKRVRAYLTTN